MASKKQRKPVPVAVRVEDEVTDGDRTDPSPSQDEQFERELCWCIEQLELGLSTRGPDSRQARDAVKLLKVLRNPKTLLVKKRQVMRTTFGDYRKKMEVEERKLKTKASQISLTTAGSSSKSKCYRVSGSKTSGQKDQVTSVEVSQQQDIASSGATQIQSSSDFPDTANSELPSLPDHNTSVNVLTDTETCPVSTAAGVTCPVVCGAQSAASDISPVPGEGGDNQGAVTISHDTDNGKTFKYKKSDNTFRFGFSSS